jgi:predicted nucleic acid-binding protein
MAEQRRIYIDTCCFVDLVKTEIKQPLTTDRQHDVWYLQKLMEAHRDGEVALFTSTLTIAECRHAGEQQLSDATRSAFTRLLMSGQYVRLVQMTPFIAQDARDLTWRHSINLKGADSIHVASAIDRKCEELLTADGRIAKLGAQAGPLKSFGLSVCESRLTTCLPVKYLQMNLDDKLN